MRTLLLLISLVILGSISDLQAQGRANTRKGFWIGLGLGDGSAGVECDNCGNDRINSWSGYLRMGGTISSHVLLGAETSGWLHSEGGIDENVANLAFVTMWYPSNSGAFYLKFGVGGMAYRATDGVDDLTATAPSLTVGTGYEFRMGQNFSLTPFFNALASSAVTLKENGTAIPTNGDISITLAQVGLGVTWH